MLPAGAAPRELIWKAWTQPELVKRWMIGRPGHSLPVCAMDLRVGGALRYVWTIEDDKEICLSGIFREIEAPARNRPHGNLRRLARQRNPGHEDF
jgi:uncharacterized protein YndB with AHSA1/START domain